MSHKKSGTGSWAGNRDRHQSRQSNGAKKKDGWVDGGKHTNSDRNRGRGLIDGFFDSLFGTKKR
mgnify:CR=1 FL=1